MGVRSVLVWGVGTVIQCVTDFLVDDACHLCAQRRREVASLPSHPYQRALCAPARLDLAAGIQIENHPLCAPCAARMETSRADAVLGWILPGGGFALRSGGVVAGSGAAVTPPSPVHVLAPFRTTDALLRLIHLVKFSRIESFLPGAAHAVAICAGARIAALPDPILVPVPMDRRSVRRRGFNQSERIAAALASRSGVPFVADALHKPRATRPQSLTGPGERLSNVRGAFAAGPGMGRILGRDAILVDDLVTTGATAAVATVVLCAGGAASVTIAGVGTAL